MDSNRIENLSFAGEDTTAGSETELQTAVIGSRDKVDLSLSVEHSNYFKNMAKRAATGDAPIQKPDALEAYLDAPEEVRENRWVRFPLPILDAFVRSMLVSLMLVHVLRRWGVSTCYVWP